ncbi:hypothetical protein V6N11_001709 [Hibiscus sabdariffa]|uniref:Uncharacterized protein n=1 Tax=Hibiscus sabdariffa TaxID=183260 RepID=A0ABR2NR94_9ROSI
MTNYAKFPKDMVSRKARIGEFETVAATEACLAMMHNKVPAKKTDHGSFTTPCCIGNHYTSKALCDPGVSINLMPKSVFQKLGIGEAKPTTVMLQLADHSYADEHAPIILGRPFLATSRVLIDFGKGELVLRVEEQQVKVNVFSVLGQQNTTEECKVLEDTTEIGTTTKPYMGAHKERDKGVVTLSDA